MWCRSPKSIAKRKFDLLPRNLFVKNVASVAQNCNKKLFFHSAKQVARFSTNSYVFEHAGVAKRKALHFGMHAAVAGRIFSFCWIGRLAGFGGLIARNCRKTQILSSTNFSAYCTGGFNAQQMDPWMLELHCVFAKNKFAPFTPQEPLTCMQVKDCTVGYKSICCYW